MNIAHNLKSFFSLKTIAIVISVMTLIAGVANSVIISRQNVKTQNLTIILTISESFRERWESKWSDILNELEVDHINPRTEKLPEEHIKSIRFMLNWVDWLGAMKSSGSLEELSILTSSIGIPIKQIINAGYTILEEDTRKFGNGHWKNLFIVAEHLEMTNLSDLYM